MATREGERETVERIVREDGRGCNWKRSQRNGKVKIVFAGPPNHFAFSRRPFLVLGPAPLAATKPALSRTRRCSELTSNVCSKRVWKQWSTGKYASEGNYRLRSKAGEDVLNRVNIGSRFLGLAEPGLRHSGNALGPISLDDSTNPWYDPIRLDIGNHLPPLENPICVRFTWLVSPCSGWR